MPAQQIAPGQRRDARQLCREHFEEPAYRGNGKRPARSTSWLEAELLGLLQGVAPLAISDAERHRLVAESVARLTRHKGIDTALRALAQLAADYPDLRYAVVGVGEEHETLQEEARQLGIGDRVRFLTDVPDRDLPALYDGIVWIAKTSASVPLH